MGYSRQTAREDLSKNVETEVSEKGAVVKAALEELIGKYNNAYINKEDDRTINIGNHNPTSIGKDLAKGAINVIAIPFKINAAMHRIQHNISTSIQNFLGISDRTPIGEIANMHNIPNSIKERIKDDIASGKVSEFSTGVVSKKFDFSDSLSGKLYTEIKIGDQKYTIPFESKIDRNYDKASKGFDKANDNLVNCLSKQVAAGNRLESLYDKLSNNTPKDMPESMVSKLSDLVSKTVQGDISPKELNALRNELKGSGSSEHKLTRQIVSACADYGRTSNNTFKAQETKEKATNDLNVAAQEKSSMNQILREAFGK